MDNQLKDGYGIPVLIAYQKTINKKRDAINPSKRVTGNVILFISERTIDKFNIPIYTGYVPMVKNVSPFSRKRWGEKETKMPAYQTLKQGLDKSIRMVRLITDSDYYLINFPYFFNIAMIRDSLFLLLKTIKK